MGKNKRLRTDTHASKKKSSHKPTQPTNLTKPQQSQAEWKSKPKARTLAQTAAQKENVVPTIPFTKYDRILLVGEGDLSFAASLVRHHGVRNLVATVFEGKKEDLEEKYPHVGENIDVVENWVPEKQGDNDIEDIEKVENEIVEGVKKTRAEMAALAELDNDEQEALLSAEAEEGLARFHRPREGKVLFGVDATKMGPYWDPVAKAEGRGRIGAYDSIQFMFPHCGGKSTDVNRQVRYNQELLVGFFQRALPCLAPKGSIVVTLFEGQPYELWCIKNLARHAGLQVDTSFKFQASAYPGYAHSRTLGVLRNKKGEISGGGWKGEDRPSRSYIFKRKDDLPQQAQHTTKKRKKSVVEDDYTDGGESD